MRDDISRKGHDAVKGRPEIRDPLGQWLVGPSRATVSPYLLILFRLFTSLQLKVRANASDGTKLKLGKCREYVLAIAFECNFTSNSPRLASLARCEFIELDNKTKPYTLIKKLIILRSSLA
ncbi:hypothetical protein FRC12_010902 [Ceratobasidium sp. 428]|nr:hypothetical protein FRC12_010902 [Ceratobasidium sp. 428]